MSWRNILLIFRREVVDQLRDRRTLFMVAILPILLYPLMGVGMVQMTMLFTEQPRTVVVLGSKDLPSPPLLDEDHFARQWFQNPADIGKLRVLTDSSTASEASSAQSLDTIASVNRTLQNAAEIREGILERKQLIRNFEQEHRGQKSPATETLEQSLKALDSRLTKLLDRSGIQVLILVPENFAAHLAERQSALVERDTTSPRSLDYARPMIIRNSADEKSAIAFRRVEAVFSAWERSILKDQLRTASLPENMTEPVRPETIDLAQQEQVSANIWAKILPALLVLMTLTGAFYPAVDLCAGEKERGTMETLLICPATRTEIVLGKFLTVLVFSCSTALLNLVSIAFTGKYISSLAVTGAASRIGDLTLPPVSTLLWVMVILAPIATLFSALCLAIATFAKSTKEGQYYLTPLLMVTLGLTMFCISPGTEMHPFYSVMPVIGPGLLLKGLMKAGGPAAEIFVYATPVLVTSIGYSVLALWWAIEQFGSEDVLFREAERFDLRLWIKHLLRDKEEQPTFPEALFCFLVILLLQFVSWKSFQSAMQSVSPADIGLFQMRLLIIQQVGLIAAPAVIMGLVLTTSVRQTFSLRWPGYDRLAYAALLPFALHPLTSELVNSLEWFFPPPPAGMAELMSHMKSANAGLVILTFAVTPAICEELAFRGFLLAGFRRMGRVKAAVVLSACAFGIIHMIPHQVFNATLLGLVLGAMCIRTRSIFPGVVFHFVYNSLGVMHDRRTDQRWLTELMTDSAPGSFFFRWQDNSLRYQPMLLVILAIVSAGLIYLLVRPLKKSDAIHSESALATV